MTDFTKFDRDNAVNEARKLIEEMATTLEREAQEVRSYLERFDAAVAEENEGKRTFSGSVDVLGWAVGRVAQVFTNMRLDMVGIRSVNLARTCPPRVEQPTTAALKKTFRNKRLG
jgi:hypothetical protein